MTVPVQLRPMTEAEFADYLPHVIDEYAGDLARARGEPIEAARERSAAVINGSLPQGRETPGHLFYRAVVPGGEVVGHLWLAVGSGRPEVALVCDIEIAAGHRGRGYGRAVLATAEAIATSRGCTRIELSVFAFNDVARRLYASTGYRTVSHQMSKSLNEPS